MTAFSSLKSPSNCLKLASIERNSTLAKYFLRHIRMAFLVAIILPMPTYGDPLSALIMAKTANSFMKDLNETAATTMRESERLGGNMINHAGYQLGFAIAQLDLI